MAATWHDLLRTLDPALSPDDVTVRRRATPVPPSGDSEGEREAAGELRDASIEPVALLSAALGDAPHACAILDDVGTIIHIVDTSGGLGAARGWVIGARLYENSALGEGIRAGHPIVAAGEAGEELLVPLCSRGTPVFGAIALACNPAQLPRTAAATILATAHAIALATYLGQVQGHNERILGTIGHELRQPLSALLTALDLVSRMPRNASANALRVAQRQTQQIIRLVDALLDVSRLSRGQLHVRSRIVDLRYVVGDGVDSVRADVAAKQQRLNLQLSQRAVWCAGDPARLQQVVVNLVTNASRYTPAQGTIDVSLHGEGSLVRLRVADTGEGLDAEARERIFQPFTHADSSQGLGLGLTISRGIAELHGGTLIAESGGRGRGSVFILELPGVMQRTREVREALARTRAQTREIVERARTLRAALTAQLPAQKSNVEIGTARKSMRDRDQES